MQMPLVAAFFFFFRIFVIYMTNLDRKKSYI